MRPVVQLEPTGCGIASVAALVGVNYTAAKHVANQIGISAADSRLWSETAHVQRLLKCYRLCTSSRPTPFVSWDALPNRALLAIKWHRVKGRAFWHWVVFVRDVNRAYVLDSSRSLKRNVRRDFWHMRPKWFIEIKRATSLDNNNINRAGWAR
ncbi:MAG: hypothetical protein IPK92_21910 [Nitrospira sp.]|jgi:hypothetical protein|nr:hypothetical protein [Nitrospira sp.]